MNETFPLRLGKEGLEAIDTFCWGLLGNGFRCEWTAYRYDTTTTSVCRGIARIAGGRYKIKRGGCDVQQEASAAQRVIAERLTSRGLEPERIVCRQGGGWSCEWRAGRTKAGWSYHCEGDVAGPSLEALVPGPCRLRAPNLAPLGPTGGARLGVNDDWPLMIREIPRTKRVGAEMLRMPLSWSLVERVPGVYDFGHYDSIYAAMVENGLQPVFVVSGAPCWAAIAVDCASGGGTEPPGPVFDSRWREFLRQVAKRYPKLGAIEVWNEPNYARFYNGGPNPERYAELLKLAYEGAKDGNAATPVISGGLAPFNKSSAGRMEDTVFLRRVYEAGGGRLFADALGFHAYSGAGPGGSYIDGLRLQIAGVRDVMAGFEDLDRPIWITEAGVSTAAGVFSPTQQAEAIAKIYSTLERIPGIPVLIVHRWRDQPGKGVESGFGLVARNGRPKPALCALAEVSVGRC
ncbi:MAG: GH39 family glycosyl hydrolase [Solirubrobacterales bacterium]